MLRSSRFRYFSTFFSHKNLEFLPLDIKKICVYVGPNHPLYHTESIDFENLSSLKFVRGVRDFFSMEHHLEKVSMGVIDSEQLHHVVSTNSDHLTIDLLLHSDVCSLGLDFMYELVCSSMRSSRSLSMGVSRFCRSDAYMIRSGRSRPRPNGLWTIFRKCCD